MKLSASRLPIAAACPGSFSLPAHAIPSSPWAARGTTIHDFIDRCFRESRDAALAALPSENAEDEKIAVLCQRIPLHEIVAHFGGEPLTEVQFAYDPEADECFRLEDDERPELPWLGGKIDGHRLMPDGESVRGADWKTGFVRVAAPLQNLQLRAYALMLSRRYEVDRVEFAVVDIDEDGFPFVRNAVFEEMELDAARAEIREIMGAVAQARETAAAWTPGMREADMKRDVEGRAKGLPFVRTMYEASMRFSVGDHCRYCEALPSCPAFSGTVQALVPVVERTLEMTPARLGELWVMAGALEIAIERFTGAVRFQVEQRGLRVPLPNGQELRATSVKSRTLSGKIVLDVLREKGMEPAFLTAAKVTLTGIEKACGDRSAEVLTEVEKQGGVSTSTHTQVRALKPSKDAKP